MSQFNLLSQKRFWPLFWTQFLGAFNDNFLKNALVILFTYQAADVAGIPASQMVPVAGGVFILPFFLFSATAGQLADKYEKSRIIRWIKGLEIAIMAMATVGFVTQQYPFLLLVLFLMGLHSTFFGPLKFSILPQHLSTDELVGGNAMIEAGTFLAILIGTIAGGVLISREGGAGWVSAGLLAVALLGYFTSRAIPVAPASDPTLKVQWNPVPPTASIFRFVRQTRSVFLAILGISWFWFFGAAMLSLFPPYCKDVLHADQSVVTLFLATFSIGIALGSLLCERLSRGYLELGLVPLGSIGITVFTADLFRVGVPEGADLSSAARVFADGTGRHIVLDLLLLSVFSGFFIVPMYTMMQERSAPSHRSRVIAGNNILNALFMVVSAGMLVGLMRAGLSIPQIFGVLALLNAAVAVYIYTVLPEFLIRLNIWVLANIFYRLRVLHADRIPKSGPAILVCNHVSFVDWMIIAAGVKRPIRFIMDHNQAKGSWLKRRLLKRAKVILIAPEHESPEVLRAAFDQAAFELRDNELVCIFPEGKITKTGGINPFKPGVERMLRETPVDVYPMAIRGMWGSFFSRKDGPADSKLPKRFWSRVELEVGERVPAAQATAAHLQERVTALVGGRA